MPRRLSWPSSGYANVFDRSRRLIRPLIVTADGGGEHGQQYRDAVENFDPNIRVKINAPNQPDLNAYVERVNSSIRQHLRQMIEAELGSIQRKAVQKALDWPKRLARVEQAYNEEYHRNIQQSPNRLVEAWFDRTSPESQELRDKAVERHSEAELRKRHKQADELRKLPVGSRVRVVRRDLQKKELAGNIRKMQRRWSDTIYTVAKRITPTKFPLLQFHVAGDVSHPALHPSLRVGCCFVRLILFSHRRAGGGGRFWATELHDSRD
eukprot:COSAG03_NODE_636_length_6600_cov_796.513921_3_plen_266_part_00